MSLINEALKKAERQRALEQAEGGMLQQGGGRARIAKRGAPMRTQTFLMIAAGAVLLVVVSAVLTGVFVTRKIEPKPAPAKPAAALVTAASAAKPPPVIVAHIPSLPASPPPATYGTSLPKSSPKPLPEPVEPYVPSAFRSEVAGPARSLSPTVPPLVAAPPPAAPAPASLAGPTRETAAPASAPPSHDARIQALVDGFHVTGIRSAGADSKVLMNERVFRVNDIVDYGYGLKLVAVTPESLTFVDSNGETYVKNF